MSILNHEPVQIPDEAVHAALLSMAKDNVGTDVQGLLMHGFDKLRVKPNALRNALTAAHPHLSAPCAVEVVDRAKRIANIYRNKDDATVIASFHKETARVIDELLSCVVSKPVDVAAVREVPVSIDKLIAELKSAEDMCFSWSGSALLANELNATDTDEGHISLYKDLCGLGNSMSYLQSEIRALSPSEPAQSVRPLEEWHEDHGNAVWWTWDNDRKEWLGEPAYIGKPLDSDWPDYHTHWTPHPAFPAAPTTEAGK